VSRVCCVSGEAPLLENVRPKLWVVVGVDGTFGVAAKGFYRVGHARPRLVMGAVNSPGCHLSVDIDHPNSGWRQRVKGRAGRNEKGKHRPRLKESHGSLPILTASSHGILRLCPITFSTQQT
jgi:hypothetical protein